MEEVKKRFYLTKTDYPERAFDASTGEYGVTDYLVVDEAGNPVTEKEYKDNNIVYVDNKGDLHALALDEVVVKPKETLADKILLTNVRRNNTATLNNNLEGGKIWSGLKEGGDLAGNLVTAFATGITPANPIRFAAEMVGGALGGTAVDATTKKFTGKSWAPFIAEKTGIRPELAALTNPGFWYGASKTGKILDKNLHTRFIKGDPEIGWNALNKDHWALKPKNLTPTNLLFASTNRIIPFLSETGKDIFRFPAYIVAKKSKGDAFVTLKTLKNKADYTGTIGNVADSNSKNLVAKYLFEDSPIISKTPWFKNISAKFKRSEKSLPVSDRYKELYPGIEDRTYVMDAMVPMNEKVYFPSREALKEYAPNIYETFGKEAGMVVKTPNGYKVSPRSNPIGIIDDVAGHNIKLAPGKDGRIWQYSQDLYKFNPVDYLKKWRTLEDPIIAEKQVSLFNNLGKPFKLFTENPVVIGVPGGSEASLYTSRLAVPKEVSLIAPYDNNAFMAMEAPRVRFPIGKYAGGGTINNISKPEVNGDFKMNINRDFETTITGSDPWGGYWRSTPPIYNTPSGETATIGDNIYLGGLYDQNFQIDPTSSKSTKATLKSAWNAVYNKLKPTGLSPFADAVIQGQMHVETGGFSKTVEGGGRNPKRYFAKYDNSTVLGNTQSGDGARFKGRGIIQLTGRYNYTKAQEWFDKIGLTEEYKEKTGKELDIVNNPDVVGEDALIGAYAAYWFLSSKKIFNELTKVRKEEDVSSALIRSITKKINGGTTHLDERIKYTKNYLKELKTFNESLT